ncbi:MAG: HAMP domain-containing methyl-accepting chemotaxis protein, partial [Chloroflexota bacterium]|nr:HAMP domain-containing methyl-accepting chemotaxis protein [Chloroflexota bacterium]
MNMGYILYAGVAAIGTCSLLLAMYLTYRRGIAIRMAVITATCAVTVGAVSFFMGLEGITVLKASIALGIAVPVVVGSQLIMVRQIVDPAKRMAETAAIIAKGDLSQQVNFTRRDEIGDLANAFRDMIAYLQEMAGAAGLLAQGDLTAEIIPRSEKDILGNALSQMIANLRQVIEDIVHVSQGLAEGDLQVTPEAEYKGDFVQIKDGLEMGLTDLQLVVGDIVQVSRGLAAGDLSVTPEAEYKGDFVQIRDGLKIALTDLQQVVGDIVRVSQGLARGDLSVTPEAEYKGDFVQVKDGLGTASSDLRQVIEDIVQVSRELAESNLCVAPEAEYQGSFTQIKDGLETALNGLNATISQTNGIVEQVVPSVEQIRAISQSLASSAEEQSAAAEEVASSLEQTDAQVRSNAESANVANQLVSQASDVANAGQEKMKSMTKAMDGIAEASREIARIIKVIDEIAFQTNLLALNAAVEAARAGQHGRGFAVVAQEVRNLAGRSAKAARETAELIEDAGQRVEEGVGIADETAGALGEIVQNVLKVKDLVAEIAAASEDQSMGVAQVSNAMVQVNEGAQAGSQQSEELASTADELGQLADRLSQETARFQLREDLAGFGLSPEMLQQVTKLVRAQAATSGDGGPAMAEPQAVERGD